VPFLQSVFRKLFSHVGQTFSTARHVARKTGESRPPMLNW
jgi:hypothetical protein